MCGIAVAIAWDDAEASVRRLIGGLRHRGDVTDPIVTPFRNCAMGTRRLRIVDGVHGVQPQLSHDNRILVAFNGEIYNHVALRRELEASGVRFKTASDTEVLASALSHWGPQALHRLNGMYAFVALDLRDGSFLAARDPFGTKPLYLMFSAIGVLFCSEIKPLLATVPNGKVLLVPPGHMMSGTDCRRFKSLTSDPAAKPQASCDATLDRLVAEAVRSRIPPDLPFALMVSGGIDSTLVAHYARETRPEAPGYFLGGTDAPDYPYVADYAERTGLDLRRVPIDIATEDTPRLIGEIVGALETFEPDNVRNGLCTSLLSQRIHADGFRVALSGEGADELFAGYPLLEQAFDSNDVGAFVRDQHIDAMHRNALQRLDRCGMRFQLEIREPFLDPELADYALGLDCAALVEDVDGRARGKAPLRKLYDLHPAGLPTVIRDRNKVPLHEGAGLDRGGQVSPFAAFADRTISNQALADGLKRFADFDIRTKEELLYLDALAAAMDVFRVPHLAERARLWVPTSKTRHGLQDYLVNP